MTKKCFAAIKSAQETMKEIETMANETLHSPPRAYSTVKSVLSLVEKWNADFGDVDPAWSPAPVKEQEDTETSAKKLGAFVQE